MNQSVGKMKSQRVKKLVTAAFFGTIAAVFMFFEFTVPFVPPFIKMDFSELPVILGGYLLGPLYGTLVAIIKILLNIMMDGTTTVFVGETVNLLGSLVYMLSAVLFYRKYRNHHLAAWGLLIGTSIVSVFLVLCNYYVMFPLYATLMNFPLEQIIAATQAVNPAVDSLLTLMFFVLLPFNVFKYGVTSILAFFSYKRLENVLPFHKG